MTNVSIAVGFKFWHKVPGATVAIPGSSILGFKIIIITDATIGFNIIIGVGGGIIDDKSNRESTPQ